MRGGQVRWVLAFDGGCAQCRGIADAVHTACAGRLEVRPLSDPLVRAWIARARPGRSGRRRPCLLRVSPTATTMATGPWLGVRLVARFGPVGAVRILRAIGTTTVPPMPPDGSGPNRRRFLQIGAGGLVTAGLLLTGAAPAAADPVESWVREHRDRLPRTYAGLAALPGAYRSAIYRELSPAERSAAWVTHLTVCRVELANPTDEQLSVIDETLALAGDPDNFTDDGPIPVEADELTRRGIAAFGVDRARAILATLGPADPGSSLLASCECSTVSDFCGGHCIGGGCTPYSPGCGFLYQYTCNGHCS